MNDQLFAHTKPYDPALLNPATNMETPGILKPQGGLWTSTHTENGSEWVEWTCLEEFRYRYHTWATSTAVDWALIQQKYEWSTPDWQWALGDKIPNQSYPRSRNQFLGL